MAVDAGPVPPGEPGARLDPGVEAFLAESSPSDTRSWHELTLDELRVRGRADIRLTSGPGDPAVTSRDLRVPVAGRRIPIRVYHPAPPPPTAVCVRSPASGARRTWLSTAAEQNGERSS